MKPKTLPCLIDVSDYHEFKLLDRYFRMLDGNFRVSEITHLPDNSKAIPYVGVIYLKGHKPTKKELIEMARQKYGEYPK